MFFGKIFFDGYWAKRRPISSPIFVRDRLTTIDDYFLDKNKSFASTRWMGFKWGTHLHLNPEVKS